MNLTKEKKIGLICGVSAFVFWGLVPIYFKALQHVPASNILAHRIVWSVSMTALLISLGKDWSTLGRAVRSGKVFLTLFFSALLVTVNWFLFIYAINTDRVLQGSLGYYINPLVNVLLGMVFLRERLRPWQALAVILAFAGTLNLALRQGGIPWISLSLAGTFGLYGLLRKTVRIEAVNGLFVETTLMFPFALGYLVFQGVRGDGAFWVGGWPTTILLFLAGAATTFPLVWFTSAARRLNYSTVGLLQYIGPTIMFFLGVFRYGEPFTAAHKITFACIWAGLAIFVLDSLRAQGKRQ
jgi:chloramphenicol-sensitive protein RarD